MTESKVDLAFNAIREEIASLESRASVSKEDVAHLLEIKKISFLLWYDPDNDACDRYGRQLEPHIAALCKKFSCIR